MNWLAQLTLWFKQQIEAVFSAFVDVMHDQLLAAVKLLLDVQLYVLSSLPALEFLQDYSICGVLGHAGELIGWLYGVLDMDRCMLAIGSAYAFRFTRKLLTLFQW